jgi:hypothetical protein
MARRALPGGGDQQLATPAVGVRAAFRRLRLDGIIGEGGRTPRRRPFSCDGGTTHHHDDHTDRAQACAERFLSGTSPPSCAENPSAYGRPV